MQRMTSQLNQTILLQYFCVRSQIKVDSTQYVLHFTIVSSITRAIAFRTSLLVIIFVD